MQEKLMTEELEKRLIALLVYIESTPEVGYLPQDMFEIIRRARNVRAALDSQTPARDIDGLTTLLTRLTLNRYLSPRELAERVHDYYTRSESERRAAQDDADRRLVKGLLKEETEEAPHFGTGALPDDDW